MLILIMCLVIRGASILIFSNSPYFGVFGVLFQALSFSFLMCFYGFPFFGLLVVLVYIGGMLVVFLFSTVLSAERYPTIGFWEACLFWGVVVLFVLPTLFSWERSFSLSSFGVIRKELGFGELFGGVGVLTCLVALILLVALAVVLSLGFEHTRGKLRKL